MVSRCCGTVVSIEEMETCYYVCHNCGKPCILKMAQINDKSIESKDSRCSQTILLSPCNVVSTA